MSTIEKSYSTHAQHYDEILKQVERNSDSEQVWNKQQTVDYWRHARLRDSALVLFKNFIGAKWLTVGDGRFGLDAVHLQSYGLDVTASDIAEPLLKLAKQKNIIKKYITCNCENMSELRTGDYDFIFCKESFHHFPRPYVALMEFLRVAQKGVILIEPQDTKIDLSIPQILVESFFNFFKTILRRPPAKYQYEESGNFVYTISERELTKAALGVGYRCVAFKQLNDFYAPGLGNGKSEKSDPKFRRVYRRIALSNFLTRLKLRRGFLTTAVIFRDIPDIKLQQELKSSGFRVELLPKSPYQIS